MTRLYDSGCLPDTSAFYELEGLVLRGQGKWKTTRCVFHGGSDSLRINSQSGGFKCMTCGIQGADEVAYLMLRHGIAVEDAVEAIDQVLCGRSDDTLALNKELPPAIEQALLELENGDLNVLKCDTERARLFGAGPGKKGWAREGEV